jgi:hypothetical protein
MRVSARCNDGSANHVELRIAFHSVVNREEFGGIPGSLG